MSKALQPLFPWMLTSAPDSIRNLATAVKLRRRTLLSIKDSTHENYKSEWLLN